MKCWMIASAAAGALLVVGTASAQDGGPRVTAGVTGGTLGIGPELGLRLSDHLGVRGSATFLNIGADFDADGNTYDGDLKLKLYGAMVDVYPFGGSFRVSGGARINRNKVDVRLTPSGEITIGEEDYTAAQVGVVSGGADVKKFSPALTLGYGGANRRGFLFGIDAGVLFQGRARLRDFTATGTAANDPAFRANLEEERRSLQEDIDKVKVYPVLQLTLGWRF